MPADPSKEQPPEYSRRRALGKLGLGLTAIAGAAFLLRNLLPSGDEGDRAARLPGPDSIFHPRNDRRMDGRNTGRGA